MTQRTKAVFKFLLDVVELYIPMISFLTIFVCFMLQIVSRYFFTPLMWPEELALHAFIWAALFGALPLALGTGLGSELRRPLGISVVGGLLLSQLLTLYTTPVIYLYMDRFRLWLGRFWASRRAVAPLPEN